MQNSPPAPGARPPRPDMKAVRGVFSFLQGYLSERAPQGVAFRRHAKGSRAWVIGP
jgi:hypothetical protein